MRPSLLSQDVQEYQEKEPELAAQFKRAVMDRKLPDNWADALPKAGPPLAMLLPSAQHSSQVTEEDKGKATRLHSQEKRSCAEVLLLLCSPKETGLPQCHRQRAARVHGWLCRLGSLQHDPATWTP